MNNTLDIIRCMEGELSKGQKKIAEYILNNTEKAAYMTAARLAAHTGVSEATVVRFAEKVGFDGYPKLQKSLSGLIKNKLTAVQRMELAKEKIGTSDVLTSVLKADMGHIEKTLETIDRVQFEKAADVISNANRIYITGVRSAAALAEFAGFYLHLIFDNVRLIKTTGGDDLFEQIMNVGKGDVFIGISFPRYSKNTVRALEYARKNGAEVIGITDSLNSPIAQHSDYPIIAQSDAISFVDSLTASFSLINALVVAVGLKNSDTVHKSFERLEEIWDEYGVYDKNDR